MYIQCQLYLSVICNDLPLISKIQRQPAGNLKNLDVEWMGCWLIWLWNNTWAVQHPINLLTGAAGGLWLLFVSFALWTPVDHLRRLILLFVIGVQRIKDDWQWEDIAWSTYTTMFRRTMSNKILFFRLISHRAIVTNNRAQRQLRVNYYTYCNHVR